MSPVLSGSNVAVSVAERGGAFDTSTPSSPCQVQTRSPAPPQSSSVTSFDFLLKSCMHGSVAREFGKFTQPAKRCAATSGSSPNAKEREPNDTESVPPARRYRGTVRPFGTDTSSSGQSGPPDVLVPPFAPRIGAGGASGTYAPPTSRSPDPRPETATRRTAVSLVSCGNENAPLVVPE